MAVAQQRDIQYVDTISADGHLAVVQLVSGICIRRVMSQTMFSPQSSFEKSKMHSVLNSILTSGLVVYVLERQQDVTQTLQKSNIAAYTPFLHADKSKVCSTGLENSQFGE